MAWFAASYVVAVLGYLGVNAVAGRWLGPDDYGFMVAAITATGLLGQVGLIGSHRAGLREVSRALAVGDQSPIGGLRNGVRAVLSVTLPSVALLAAIGTWVAASSQPTGPRLALALAAGALVQLGGAQQLWANYVRGFGHVRLAGLLEGRSGGALVAGGQALLMTLGWLLVPDWGLPAALGAVALGYVTPLVLARSVVQRRWRTIPRPVPRLLPDLRAVARRDWRFLSTQVAAYLNTGTEIWVAALLLVGPDASAYSAGQRLAMLLLLPLTALQVVLAPVIARAGARQDLREIERLLRTAASVATVVCLTLALPLLLAPGFVLDVVLGEGFGRGAPVLVLLALGYIGNVATGMAGTTVSMLGHEGVAAKVQWVGAVLRWVVGVPAALAFGLLGLAVSALAVSTVVFTMMWWSARRATGVDTRVTLRPELGLLRRTPG